MPLRWNPIKKHGRDIEISKKSIFNVQYSFEFLFMIFPYSETKNEWRKSRLFFLHIILIFVFVHIFVPKKKSSITWYGRGITRFQHNNKHIKEFYIFSFLSLGTLSSNVIFKCLCGQQSGSDANSERTKQTINSEWIYFYVNMLFCDRSAECGIFKDGKQTNKHSHTYQYYTWFLP